MIRDDGLFIMIDKEYTGTTTNSNKSKSSIEGRGTIAIRTEDSKVCERKIRFSNALIVLDNSKQLTSVSKLRAADNELLFGKDVEIRTKGGAIFWFGDHDNLFLLTSTGTKNCNLVNGDWLGFWHRPLGHNNIEDISKLKDHALGLRISEHDERKC